MYIRKTIREHKASLIAVLFFCIFILLSSVLVDIRYKTLSFQEIFSLPFAVKAFNPNLQNLQKHLTTDFGGRNMFAIQGMEQKEGFYHWLHFEPIKLLNALLYRAVPSVLFLFNIWAVLYFLPLLYAAVIIWKQRGSSALLLLISLVSWAMYPNNIIIATVDLSPWILLPSFSILLMLSLIYRRSLTENLIFLNLLFLVREEALVFSAAAIMYTFIREYIEKRDHRISKFLFFNWFAWAMIVFAYFFWAGYPIILPDSVTRAYSSPIFWFAIMTTIVIFILFVTRMHQHVKTMLQSYGDSIVFAIISLAPIASYVLISFDFSQFLIRLAYDRLGMFSFTMIVLTLLSFSIRHKQVEKILIGFFLGCTILFIVLELIPHPSSTFAYISRYRARENDATLVFLAQSKIPLQASTLVDEHTEMLFYAHNNAYSFSSLPLYLLPPLSSETKRFYPANENEMISLIKNSTQYVVVGRSNAVTIMGLVQKAGKHANLVKENDSFVFYKIE